MTKGLLSIVTPCFNSGRFVYRLLDSILDQTYPNIEMFVIDDGSTDNTKEVIDSYIEKFEQKGYKLIYIYQNNSGQSEAINRALKLITGEYFVWPDSDDYYRYPNSIEKLITELSRQDKTTAMIRCRHIVVDETTHKTIRVNSEGVNYENLFEDCLYGNNNFWFLSGGYIVKSECLYRAIPTSSIYTSKNAGQNWQLLLPVLYKYNCHTLEELLYVVTERSESHSRGQYSSYSKILQKLNAYEATIVNTILNIEMPISEKESIIQNIKRKYLSEKIGLSYSNEKNKEYRKYLNESDLERNISYYIKHLISYIPLGLKGHKKIKILLNKIIVF